MEETAPKSTGQPCARGPAAAGGGSGGGDEGAIGLESHGVVVTVFELQVPSDTDTGLGQPGGWLVPEPPGALSALTPWTRRFPAKPKDSEVPCFTGTMRSPAARAGAGQAGQAGSTEALTAPGSGTVLGSGPGGKGPCVLLTALAGAPVE